MALKYYAGDFITGLSTDTKPTTTLTPGYRFLETNTGLFFTWDGTQWNDLGYAVITDLGAAAFSNDYNDLDNTPDLSAFEEVLVFSDLASFPATGETEKLYIASDTGLVYKWDGSQYVQITGNSAIWGNLSGTLSDQTDLQNALNDKLDEANKASQADAEAGTDDTKWMTPLKTKQAIDEFASDSGEANTASNVGTGEGVFKEKVGVDLRFKSLVAGDNVNFDTTDADEIKIDVDGGAEAAGDVGDVQFNDGADNLDADAALNYDKAGKELLVPDLKVKESGENNVADAHDEGVYKVTTETVGSDEVVRHSLSMGNGQDVIIASYIHTP